MKKRKQKISEKELRALAASYSNSRISWIDRVVNAIDSSPGAPPASREVAKTAERLREQLLIFRAAFVDAINSERSR